MTLSKIARPALALLLMLTMVNIWAQSGTSSALAGSVLDPSGAVISNAQVKATDVNTGSVREVQTNPEGRFLFSQVNPGTYRIEVHAQGFGLGRSQPTIVAVGQTALVNFSLSPAASLAVGRSDGAICVDEPGEPEYLDHPGCKDHQEPAQSRAGPYLHRAVRAGRIDEYSGIVERRQGRGRLWQCRVQRTARDLERLHPRRVRLQRSFPRTEYRPFHEPRHRSGRLAGSDREYQLLCGRSGTLRSLTDQLLHQVGIEPVSRRPVRDMERLAAQRN